MGISFTPDGMVQYDARRGVDLTVEDPITSPYPYGYRCEYFNTIFFNVAK